MYVQHLDRGKRRGGGGGEGAGGRGPAHQEDVWDTRQPPLELLDNLAEQLRLSDFSADASRPS